MKTKKPQTSSKHAEIKLLISDYALLYKRFEKIQGPENDAMLPVGDQKTGVIGEYYAKCYIEQVFNGGKTISYQPSGSDYDLEYKNKSGDSVKVQVKAVSWHSCTRTISPVKLLDEKGKHLFDELYLISLDENFLPDGFWINDYKLITKRIKEKNKKNKNKIEGSFMKGKSKSKESEGSGYFDFTNDKVKELREAIARS